MSSPLNSILANLDGSIQAAEIQIERLHAALLVDESQLAQVLTDACNQSDLLRERVESERPDANWNNRSGLENLLADLERAARQRQIEQRRNRLLELANELYAGSIRHRFAARTSALDALRQEAVRELQSQAAQPEPKELPGPDASEWLVWAFNLEDEADAETLASLRSDFPALEHFTGEMEEDYWVPGQRSNRNGPPPSPQSSDSGRNGNRARGGPGNGDTAASARSHRQLAPNAPKGPVASQRSDYSEPISTGYSDVKPPAAGKKSSTKENRQARGTSAALLTETPAAEIKPANGNGAVPAAESAVAPPVVAETSIATESTHRGDSVVPPSIFGLQGEATAEQSESGFGARLAAAKLALGERFSLAWVGGIAFVVLFAIFFAVIYHMHRKSGMQSMPTVSAAGSETAAADSNVQGDTSTTPGGSSPKKDQAQNAATGPLLHRLAAEGAQKKLQFSVESCGRGAGGKIECWGYVSNQGSDTSRVSLDRIDVVDGKGNTFTLDRNADFGFPGGRSSSLAPGARTKYSLKVPDQDPKARTLTLYVDLSNPPSLEYTFRDVPIAQ